MAVVVASAGLILTSGAAMAETPSEAEASGAASDREGKIEKLEKQMEVMAEEIEGLRTKESVPAEKIPLEGRWGLGPAASKVYHKEHGLSLGAYGEVRLRADVDDNSGDDIFDALRAVLYVGYRFNEHILVNTELEFEHAGSGGGGSVSTEFMTLDFLFDDAINARGGLVLIPMGFVNELHEPTLFYGNERPEPERVIIPSTWREMGAGFFGDVGDRFEYRIYAVNGFDGSGFDYTGLRGGRQKGSEALVNNWAFVARGDFRICDGGLVGGSVYTGYSGQNQSGPGGDLPNALTTIYELHAEYRDRGAVFRGLFTQAFVHDARKLSDALAVAVDEAIAKNMIGGYAELGYDVLPLFVGDTDMSFEPFVRFEHFDTQRRVPGAYVKNKNQDVDVYVAGASFKPHPQVVIKLDYRNFRPEEGKRADEVQAGFGFVF